MDAPISILPNELSYADSTATALSNTGLIGGTSGPVPVCWSSSLVFEVFNYSLHAEVHTISETGAAGGYPLGSRGQAGCPEIATVWT